MAKAKSAKKKVATHVGVLIDQSGSMMSRVEQTISGYNEFLQSLKKDEGDEVTLTLSKFSSGFNDTSDVECVYNSEPIKNVQPLTTKTYTPAGGTPLFDAIGKTIAQMKDKVKKGDLVLFAILTDGDENASREYRKEAIKELVANCEKEGWKFVFLGVGIDAFAGGANVGLSAASSFNISPQNVQAAYSMASTNTTSMRGLYAASGSLHTVAAKSMLMEKDRKKLSE